METKYSSFKWILTSGDRIAEKQFKVLTWWWASSEDKDKDIIIADGAVRSGKTLSMSFSFVNWAMTRFNNQIFGMAGKTVGSFRRNVLTHLKRTLYSEGYEVHERRTENLFIVQKNNKINEFFIFGGKDEGSQDLIQGVTLAGMFFDEIALMPESFINQAIARCSVDGSKLFMNCNPEGLHHYFKVNWIDKKEEKNILYVHFDMDDNLSLSEKIRERYKSMFTGVFYQRYILGLWAMCEGRIYDCFSEERHVVSKLPEGRYCNYVGIDYGTKNPFAAILLSHNLRTNQLFCTDELYYDSGKTGQQKTDFQYSQMLQEFIKDKYPQSIFIDPSALSFKTQLQADNINGVQPAKNDVLDGIRLVASLLSQDKLFVLKGKCPNLLREFSEYVWNIKSSELGIDCPLKQSDHILDSLRYVCFTQFKYMANINGPINIKGI